ncbi:MAG: CatB-related O-acetyltransferase [Treponemataceae bacterium]
MEIEKFRELSEKLILEKIDFLKSKKIVIWGCGKGGKIVCEILKRNKIDVSFYIDSKKELQDNITVFDKDILLRTKEYFVIVALLSFNCEVSDFLNSILYDETNYLYLAQGYDYNLEDTEYKGCKIGYCTYGYKDLLQIFPLAKSIGRFCSINGTARIWNNHSLDCVSTHPFLDHPLFNTQEQMKAVNSYVGKYGKHLNNAVYENSKIRKNEYLTIGNDVWIGANVVLLPGINIADGAVIAAGSVVTKDIEPYAIVGGIPAKLIKYRFSKNIIESFLRIKWWNWDLKKIRENQELFYQPELFCKTFDNDFFYSRENKI